MREYGRTATPVGYLGYCRRNPQDCQSKQVKAETVTMNKQRWAELNRVNLFANRSVVPVSDQDLYRRPEYWTLPGQYGDCEDYVLLKRKMLVEKGWPESALLITVLRDERQAGHAVLTVATDMGDLILDNRKELINAWADTPYTYYLRQSRTNPSKWVALRPSASTLGPRTTNN
ncbi:MAG: transglutaminase-like cysteine peptidase [Alphaproteobacteria bacterium]